MLCDECLRKDGCGILNQIKDYLDADPDRKLGSCYKFVQNPMSVRFVSFSTIDLLIIKGGKDGTKSNND